MLTVHCWTRFIFSAVLTPSVLKASQIRVTFNHFSPMGRERERVREMAIEIERENGEVGGAKKN